MSEREKIRKELEEIAPTLLQQQGEKGGFAVPKNYFSALTENVMGQLNSATDSRPKAKPVRTGWWEKIWSATNLLFRPAYAVGALASIAVLVAAIFWLRSPAETPAPALAAISDDELTEYIVSNIDEFSLDLIVESGDPQLLDGVLPLVPEEEMDRLLDELLDEMEMNELEEVF